MTSHCAEPDLEHYRTNPRLLTRRVADTTLVCVPAESPYQDVRVLRLDELATHVVVAARTPRTLDELAAAIATGVGSSDDGAIAELVVGLTAARVLQRDAAHS